MRLSEIVQTSQDVSRTRAKLRKIERIAQCLRQLAPQEILIGASYLTGNLPQGRIGLGPSILWKVLEGVAPAARPCLSLEDADRAFHEIAATTGAGSAQRREEILGRLFAGATADEQRFLVRLVVGELRQGALEGIMVEALARAAQCEAAPVRRAAMVSGDLVAVAQALLTDGPAALERFRLQLMTPVQPMLAQTAQDVPEALTKLQRAIFELKMDGARVQAHKDQDVVRVYTRRLNDVTQAVPEVVEAVRSIPASSLILDGETLALREDGRPYPFQTTMRRFGRRSNVERMRSELPLAVYFFDCLQFEGDDLIDRRLEERHAAIDDALPSTIVMPRVVSSYPEEAEAFLARALAEGHEGIMAKAMDSLYEAGNRGSAWLKLKVAHTLDLVVLAAEWGHGRRRGWLSNLHLGARDVETGQFAMLGKTFKGLTDAMLEWQTQELLGLEIGRDEHTVHVRPELVVEIAFNEIQASPRYASGLALRFARVKRHRQDKQAEDADSMETVRGIFHGAGQPSSDA
ncbi:MAG: ATP-dependent DNA ligase [Pseudomonadales bacterium]